MDLICKLVLLCIVSYLVERSCCNFVSKSLSSWPTMEENPEEEPITFDDHQEEDLWLRLHIVPATWQEARLRCRLENGVIASPTTDALTSKILSLMGTHRLQGTVFTGINALISKGYFMSMEGVPLADMSVQWVQGEPGNANNNEDCLVMDMMGKLADVNCSSAHPFICARNNSKMVDNECGVTHKDYKMEHRIGSCYKFHDFPRTWHEAAAACSEEGGHLAIINSFPEHQFLKQLFSAHPDHIIKGAKHPFIAFIGFWDWNQHDDSGKVNGEWLTIFGESLADAGWDQWATNKGINERGGEFCGAIDRDGLLNVADCDVKSGFICEITPK